MLSQIFQDVGRLQVSWCDPAEDLSALWHEDGVAAIGLETVLDASRKNIKYKDDFFHDAPKVKLYYYYYFIPRKCCFFQRSHWLRAK